MKILLIEDAKGCALNVQQELKKFGNTVDLYSNTIKIITSNLINNYDLIILDITLPKQDNWLILKTLRQINQIIPILLISEDSNVDGCLYGLKFGANDFLAKPLNFSELKVRILALRNLPHHSYNTNLSVPLRIADLQIDLEHHYVMRGAETIALTVKEFALLKTLMQNAGQVLSRALIMSEAWNINFAHQTSLVDVTIRRLRLKVDNNHKTKLIHSVRGRGYILEERCT